jgi:hypothetical protein
MSAGVICDNQIADPGAKAVLSDWKASTVAMRGGADKRCKRLWNKADGILGRANGQRIDGALSTCTANAPNHDA